MSEFKVTSKAVIELLDNAEFCKKYEILEDNSENLFVLMTGENNTTVELSSGRNRDSLFIRHRCLSPFGKDVSDELIKIWNDHNVILNLRKTIYDGNEWLILTRSLFIGYGVSSETIEFEIQGVMHSIPELRELHLEIATKLG